MILPWQASLSKTKRRCQGKKKGDYFYNLTAMVGTRATAKFYIINLINQVAT
jgi:hypothetical protein